MAIKRHQRRRQPKSIEYFCHTTLDQQAWWFRFIIGVGPAKSNDPSPHNRRNARCETQLRVFPLTNKCVGEL
jgi:hypothetical protein